MSMLSGELLKTYNLQNDNSAKYAEQIRIFGSYIFEIIQMLASHLDGATSSIIVFVSKYHFIFRFNELTRMEKLSDICRSHQFHSFIYFLN